MSLQHDTTTRLMNAVPLASRGISFTMRRMFAPLLQQANESFRVHRIGETRKATRREISGLPASLQQDIAFSDGTVIALDRP